MSVRPALDTDASRIAEILRGTGWFEHLAAEAPEKTERRVEEYLRHCLTDRNSSIYVSELRNGDVVGYACVHWLANLFLPGPEGYLSELFVGEMHRGKGLGHELLEVVVGEAKNRGCSRLMLITNRRRESYKREFYSKAGWVERDSMANFVFYL